jgi:hypothetical protein
MFRVNFKTLSAVPAHDNGGNIHILFPTVDTMGNPNFPQDLGGYKSGDDMGCRFITSGAGIIAPLVATPRLKCRMI